MLESLAEDVDRLKRFWSPERGLVRADVVAIAAWLGAASVLGLVAPYLVKIIVDDVVGEGRAWLLAPVVGVGLAAYGLAAWTRYRGRVRAAAAGQECWYRLRNEVYGHLQGLELAYHESSDRGDHVSRVQ
ncbi:MAG: hypothetical protein ABEL76_05855, partial [Bradymonadaceae bacterium]